MPTRNWKNNPISVNVWCLSTNLYSIGCKWEEIRLLNWTRVRSSSKNTLYLTVQAVFTHLKCPGTLEKSTTTEMKEKQLCLYYAWWNDNFIHQTHALITSCVSYLLPYLIHHWRSVPRASVYINALSMSISSALRGYKRVRFLFYSCILVGKWRQTLHQLM